MDKYDERVFKILEKKKLKDIEKKRKKKTLVQCITIVFVCVLSVSAFIVIPKTDILGKTDIPTVSELEENNIETYSDTIMSQDTEPTTETEFLPLPNEGGGDTGEYIDPYTTKYRRIYYNFGSSGLDVYFASLVTDEEYDEWMRQYYANQPGYDDLYTEGEEIVEPTRMKIVDFIMYFDIPRDVFEEANNTRCHNMIKWGDVPVMNPKDYKEQEEFEVYNTDIIYTFDDEIINAYYERGEYPFETEEEYFEAIENNGYITKTEDFIMLEGFEKVTLPALPPDAEPIWIDFDWRSKRCR